MTEDTTPYETAFPPAPAPSRPEDRGAEDLGSCSYLRGVGSCSFGCHSEPACITERPSGGWPSEPPPRDPAGEGEEVCETCDHFEGEHVEVTSYGGMVVEGARCTAGCFCRGFRARPSSPTGETPCVTCGLGADPDCPCGANEGRHAEHECDTGDAHPYVPTGETAGQGVEEAWRRGRVLEYQQKVEWTNGDRWEFVPLAVEQAIRAEALAEYAEGHDMHCENEARATAAEAERDRLREALRGWILACDTSACPHGNSARFPSSAWFCDDCVEAARDALAGESTGAATDGEGERDHLRAALEEIATDAEGLACSDLPHCPGGDHASDCAVGIARRALRESESVSGASEPLRSERGE